MAKLKNPMKAPNEIVSFDYHAIHYPQLASTKFDGFRCLNLCGERLLSPNMKDFKNIYLMEHLSSLLSLCHTDRLVTDGEVWSPLLTFSELSSIIRSHDKPLPSHIKYYVFDLLTEDQWDNNGEPPFIQRYLNYKSTLAGFPNVVLVEQWHIVDSQEAETFFLGQLEQGHEGMILRQEQAGYKHGRCTTNQDGMWKFKEFTTLDGIIVSCEVQWRLKDGVTREHNELGHLKREYSQDLYEPDTKIGSFKVRCTDQSKWNGVEFGIKPGRGFTDYDKKKWFFTTEKLIGKHVEFKFMPHGSKDKPRIGSLVRFRNDKD
jgi:hypothetical protein